ncbi:Protein of unknown function [Belliella buryatensis]|uniref:DUF2911 domain-containing protein n=1 Tax=Belliella buryatensis TaxID=1500549 RepID=A0A239ENR1_9BACT|nr:DUF2911 domain-containing protein [Belliella buryatensis]SNS46277.1 Protein of unknown function [Belliella buryatensis]
MKKSSLILIFLMAFGLVAQTQDEKPSPAKTAEGEINGAKITINYSSPAVKGRTIWGDLVPLGQVWRAGANDATTIEFSKDVKVQGKDLPAGKYSFFVIPGEMESTFIFNKVAKQWGAYSYDQSQDALRVTVPSVQGSAMEERLVYEVTSSGFEIRWEYGRAAAKVE